MTDYIEKENTTFTPGQSRRVLEAHNLAVAILAEALTEAVNDPGVASTISAQIAADGVEAVISSRAGVSRHDLEQDYWGRGLREANRILVAARA